MTIWLACSGCGVEQEPLSVAASLPLLNGEVDRSDAAIVGLIARGAVYCTGALIGPRTVLTAAHCVDTTVPDGVFFGTSLAEGGRVLPVALARAHPEFLAGGLSEDTGAPNDIGAVLLDADPPTDAVPLPLLEGALTEALLAEAPLRIIGFGGLSPVYGAAGIKRTGGAAVDSVQPRTFYTRADPARICFGDSGGPALLATDGREYVAGVAAGGDPDCAEYAVHTRVDAFRDEFLRDFPTPQGQEGERCHQDGNCVSGLCLAARLAGSFAYCSTPCMSDAECSDDLRCTRDDDGARYCRFAGEEPGALGSSCADDADCASGPCRAPADADGASCTLACAPDDEVACPAGFVCGPSATGGHACFRSRSQTPSAPEPRVAGEQAQPPPTEACSVHLVRVRRPAASVLILLAALALLVARRFNAGTTGSRLRAGTAS